MATIHAHVACRPDVARVDGATKLHDAIGSAFATVRTWYFRAETRRELRALGEHLLEDIGMSRTEVTKPFWQA